MAPNWGWEWKCQKRRSSGTQQQHEKINKTNTYKTHCSRFPPLATHENAWLPHSTAAAAAAAEAPSRPPTLCSTPYPTRRGPHPCVECSDLPAAPYELHFFSSVQVKFSIWGWRSVTQWNFLVSSRLVSSCGFIQKCLNFPLLWIYASPSLQLSYSLRLLFFLAYFKRSACVLFTFARFVAIVILYVLGKGILT